MQVIQPKIRTLFDARLLEIADPVRPEKNLLAAVLERAIADILSNLTDDEAQKSRRDAEDWLFYGPLEGSIFDLEPFSFAWVCQHLGLDALAWRKRIRSIKQGSIRYQRLGNHMPNKNTLKRTLSA